MPCNYTYMYMDVYICMHLHFVQFARSVCEVRVWTPQELEAKPLSQIAGNCVKLRETDTESSALTSVDLGS